MEKKTFTFGSDHKHPITGASLKDCYIQIPGDWYESRISMMAVFGDQWAMQYEKPEDLRHLDQMTEVYLTEELRAE